MALVASDTAVQTIDGVGSAAIVWDFSFSVLLFERLHNAGDSPSIFEPLPTAEGQERQGSFVKELRAGDVWEVLARRAPPPDASRGAQDQIAFERAVGYVVVQAVFRREPLISSNLPPVIGGTFFRKNIATPRPTHAMMVIGVARPRQNSFGISDVVLPLIYVGAEGPNSFFNLTTDAPEATSERHKLPGNRWALIRAMDREGIFDELEIQFTTLRRKYEIHLNEVDLQQRGDESATAELSVTIEVWRGVPSNWTQVAELYSYNDSAPLTPYSFVDYDGRPTTITIGPQRVGIEAAVSMDVVEHDDIFDPDDRATSLALGEPDIVRVRAGEATENSPVDMVVNARSDDGDLEVDFRVNVIVQHMP